MLRISQRIPFTTRISVPITPGGQRFSSSGSTRLNGLPDNAFNRERQAIKDHAAATSVGTPLKMDSIIASVNAWVLWKEHWEHFSHLPPLEERTQYAYQNIRTKNFFWGDGDKTLL
ncbi:hypothetical protein GcC1_052034 [Golovinomyces cichoracearum]|uniref:Uncharacterized protein n=1 Tax=Golovinomyces cichoracearum TaxID=62708 RepID=A0A420IWE0_9PEZI|nr:hypothetical protein GcC1_052034 [Golovinomyces cichoracearum]